MRIDEFSAQWLGRTIEGGYPLQQLLSSGESSAVFLTTYAERSAAVKLVRSEPEEAEAQLLRWRDASKLSHINLVRILATGRCKLDGISLLYIVMERAEEDLSQVLPDRSLTAVEAREMLEPTLTVLEYIHRQGFAHAHLKPSNIMAVEDRLKLSSDGIVRAGTKLGPEPTEHDPPERTASPAGDAWSLGVTLVEVLTQRLPSNGVVPPDLPETFAAIARGCLKKNPADRLTIPQISNLLSPAQVPVVPRKKRYTPIGVMILLAALVITVAGVMIMQSDTPATAAKQPVVVKVPTPEPQPAPPPPQEQPKQVAKAVKAKPEPPPETKAPAPEPVAVVPVSGITSEPLPEITDKARNTIHGKVRFTVRVDVAPSGSVTDAKVESSGASKYFSERALASVRQWKFEPVSVNGSEVGQRWKVRFEFLKSGTKVQPQRVSP